MSDRLPHIVTRPFSRAFWWPRSRRRIAAELAEEFRFHIEERIDELVASGMTRKQAALEVEGRFGDYERLTTITTHIDETSMERQARGAFVAMMGRELRQAARALRRTPGYTSIAVATLALGIGAATAIFTVLDAVVLRPLPYPHAGELVAVLHPATVPGSGERKWGLSPGGYFQLRDRTHSFSAFGMYTSGSITVRNGTEAELVRLAQTTTSVLTALQARAAFGRLFTDDDDKPGAPDVVMIGHDYFMRRYGGDPKVIGQRLVTSGGGSYEIVGVMEPGFALPMPGPFASAANLAGFGVDVWMPRKADPAGPFYNEHAHVGIARIKPGVSLAAAQRDLEQVFARFPDNVPSAYSKGFIEQYNFRIAATPLQAEVLGPTLPRSLWMLLGAVALLLLIAAANVGNLFLVRLESRRREATIRMALGAERLRMAAYYLAEASLLCGAAGIIGVLLAAVALRGLIAVAPTDIPRLGAVTLDVRSVGAAIVLSVLVAALLGAIPMFRRLSDFSALRESARGMSASSAQRWTRHALVVGQIALSLMLLAGGGVLLRSFMHLRSVHTGFDAKDVWVGSVSLPFSRYKSAADALPFHREFARRVGAIAGVSAVGGMTRVPLEDFGSGCQLAFREGRPFPPGEVAPCVAVPITLPGTLEALRIPVQGRALTWMDVEGRSQATVVTRALADRLWPGEDPIGKGIANYTDTSGHWYRVVGVIPELRADALDQPPTEAVFYPATPLYPTVRNPTLNNVTYFVRTSGIDPLSITGEVRRIVSELDPLTPLVEPRSLQHIVDRSTARAGFLMLLLAIAASMALILSAVGLYGTISYVVTQRRTEIGIRMALGAGVRQTVRMVFVQSVVLCVMGIGIGLAGAVGVSRVLQSLVYETSPTDPLVLVGAPVVLLVVGVVASVVPARRAARIEPVEAMKG